MVRQRGGIAPNIAYTMALFGEQPRLFATAGEDFDDYRLWLESNGVDASGVRIIPGEYTASFFANTDRSNSQIASFYPGAMAYAGDLSLYELTGDRPDLVMISPNDPKAMTRYVLECREMGIPYLYDPSQQIPRLSDEDLLHGLDGAWPCCQPLRVVPDQNRTQLSFRQSSPNHNLLWSHMVSKDQSSIMGISSSPSPLCLPNRSLTQLE
jgi:adenosine kinase